MTALLNVKGLQRHFFVEGKKEWLADKKILRAVDGVTLSVQRGQTLGSLASRAAANQRWQS